MPPLRAKKTLNRFFGKGGISDERLYAQEHEEPQAANRTSAWGPALDGSGRADVFGEQHSVRDGRADAGHIGWWYRDDATGGAADRADRSHRQGRACVEAAPAVSRVGSRAEHRLQRLERRNVPGRHRTAAQRCGVSGCAGSATDSGSDDGGRLLPARPTTWSV